MGSSRWLGRAQRGPASGGEQPPPVEPTRKRRLNYEMMQLLRENDYLLAAGYLCATLLGCAALFICGSLAAKAAFTL